MDTLKPLFDFLSNALRSVGLSGRLVEYSVQVLVYGIGAAIVVFLIFLCLGTLSSTIVSLLQKRGYTIVQAERIEKGIYRLTLLLLIGAALYFGLEFSQNQRK
jgi:hypothetical protein